MKANVWHMSADGPGYIKVAVVDCPTDDVDTALEYCWRWTNNVLGSWSKQEGGDANERVNVTYERADNLGLRSSMMGDIIEICDNKRDSYVIASFGFKKRSRRNVFVVDERNINSE